MRMGIFQDSGKGDPQIRMKIIIEETYGFLYCKTRVIAEYEETIGFCPSANASLLGTPDFIRINGHDYQVGSVTFDYQNERVIITV